MSFETFDSTKRHDIRLHKHNEAGEEEQEEVSVEDSPLIDAARNVEKGLKSKE